jgi:hypothetical protein
MDRKPMTVRQQRAALASPDVDKREAVVQELEAIASGVITDVLNWDDLGQVFLTPSEKLSERSRRGRGRGRSSVWLWKTKPFF